MDFLYGNWKGERRMKSQMKLKKAHIGRMIKMLIGMIVFAIGVNVFVVPIGLYNGGFLGFAQIIRTVLTEYLHINFGTVDISGIIYFGFNVPLFFMAYRTMGKEFFIRNLFGAGLLMLFLTIVPVPSEIIIEDPLTACFIGGILTGWGTAAYLKEGASCGGQDILGIYFTRKYTGFSLGKMNNIVNMSVFVICAFLFDLTTVIYSVIYAMIMSVVIDKFHLQNICIEATIFTKSGVEEIKEYILKELVRGCSIWEAKGGYTEENTTIIYTVIDKYQMHQLKQFVHSVDNSAFVVCKEDISIEGNFIKKI